MLMRTLDLIILYKDCNITRFKVMDYSQNPKGNMKVLFLNPQQVENKEGLTEKDSGKDLEIVEKESLRNYIVKTHK